MSTALKNKKIKVMPIIRKGGWLKPGHDGEFMYTSATKKYCVPIDGNTGCVVDPLKGLSEDEIKDLANRLAMKPEDFNVFKKVDNYWNGKYVKLDKQVHELDLNKPVDLINYLILKSNTDSIAPSFETRLDKGTYKFMLVDEQDQIVEKRKTNDKKMTAYKHLGRIEVSDVKMRNFLKVYGKGIPADATRDQMATWIGDIIEDNLDGFLSVIEDSQLDNKVELAEAVACKAITQRANKTYALTGGQLIGTADEALKFLHDPKNSDILMAIRGRIEQAK